MSRSLAQARHSLMEPRCLRHIPRVLRTSYFRWFRLADYTNGVVQVITLHLP